MKTKNLSLSVIVPFFNEEKYLEKSVNRLLKINICDQIILVDDFSNDKSLKIAQRLELQYNNIHVLPLDKNRGKGNAIRKALPLIDSTHVIVHDADLEYFPDDIVQMFQLVKETPQNLILGSRTLSGKKRENRYKVTYYANKYFTYLFSILNLTSLSDIASCYWLIKTDTLRMLDIKEKGFSIEVEVLSKFLRTNNIIIEVPIKYSGRTYEDGKKIQFRDGVKIFFKILKYSKALNFFKRI